MAATPPKRDPDIVLQSLVHFIMLAITFGFSHSEKEMLTETQGALRPEGREVWIDGVRIDDLRSANYRSARVLIPMLTNEHSPIEASPSL